MGDAGAGVKHPGRALHADGPGLSRPLQGKGRAGLRRAGERERQTPDLWRHEPFKSSAPTGSTTRRGSSRRRWSGGTEISRSRPNSEKRRRCTRVASSGAVLIEAAIHERDDRFSVGDCGQAGADQAAHGEGFPSEDGRTVNSDVFDVPTDSVLRIALLLYFVETAKEPDTSYDPLAACEPVT